MSESAEQQIRAASEPAGDVVDIRTEKGMCMVQMRNAIWPDDTPHDWTSRVTATYQIAREHVLAERDKQWESAIREVYSFKHVGTWNSDLMLHRLRHILASINTRLTQQPSLQERVDTILRKHGVTCSKSAAEIIALVQAEGGKQ